MAGLLSTILALMVASARGLDDGLALTPPMGWRSWNCYNGDIDDATIRAVVDAMSTTPTAVLAAAAAATEGSAAAASSSTATTLAALGYTVLGIDDGWQACGAGMPGAFSGESFHAADGTPLLNASKFGDLAALTSLVNYGHAAGLEMGWCARRGGARCCVSLSSLCVLFARLLHPALAACGSSRIDRGVGLDGQKKRGDHVKQNAHRGA